MLLFDLFEKPWSFPKYLWWRHRQDLNLHCEIRMTKRMQIYATGLFLMILGIPDTKFAIFLISEALSISGNILYLQNSKQSFHSGSLIFFSFSFFMYSHLKHFQSLFLLCSTGTVIIKYNSIAINEVEGQNLLQDWGIWNLITGIDIFFIGSTVIISMLSMFWEIIFLNKLFLWKFKNYMNRISPSASTHIYNIPKFRLLK